MLKPTLAALCFVVATPAAAQASGDMVTVDVLPGWRTEAGSHMAALRVTLAPGWKTYWRAPGDAGIPAQFDWRGSANMHAVAVHWPTPDVFHQNGLTSVGYYDHVVLPVEITPKSAGQAISVSGEIHMGVCQDICVPVSVRVSAELPATSARPDARITAALADRPMTRTEAGVQSVTCAIAAAPSGGVQLTAHVNLPTMGEDEFTVVELPGAPVWVSEAVTSRQGNTLIAKVDLVPNRGESLALDRSRLRITILGQRGAVDIHGCD